MDINYGEIPRRRRSWSIHPNIAIPVGPIGWNESSGPLFLFVAASTFLFSADYFSFKFDSISQRSWT